MEDHMINPPDETRQWPLVTCPRCDAEREEDCQCDEGHGDTCDCPVCESERRSDEDTARANAKAQDGGWFDTTREAEE